VLHKIIIRNSYLIYWSRVNKSPSRILRGGLFALFLMILTIKNIKPNLDKIVLTMSKFGDIIYA